MPIHLAFLLKEVNWNNIFIARKKISITIENVNVKIDILYQLL